MEKSSEKGTFHSFSAPTICWVLVYKDKDTAVNPPMEPTILSLLSSGACGRGIQFYQCPLCAKHGVQR